MPRARSHGDPCRGRIFLQRPRKTAWWFQDAPAGRWTALALCAWIGAAAGCAAGGLDWESGAGFRSAPLPVSASGHAGFQLLPPETTGIDFTNTLSDLRAAENQIRMNGSGVALGDVDGDGWCDIYFCGLEGGNALYRNLGGWRFTNVTESAGVACAGQFSTGATFADVDGDGDLDLLVNGLGVGTRLFLNDGRGKFSEATDSGLIRQFCATTSTLADVDGDGALDLYVADYRTTTVRTTGLDLINVNGRRMLRPQDRDQYELKPDGRLLENGEPDQLYRNLGRGRFEALSWTDGRFVDEDGRPLTAPPRDWGLSAMFRDLDGDGAVDLYVCNDFHTPDRIWINDGHGRFRALARPGLRHTSTFSMAVDVADLNRDGWDDILVADMFGLSHARRMMQCAEADPYLYEVGVWDERPQFDRNTLQLNRGDGTYAEIAYFAGLEASDWTWSIVCLDVDLDGYEDVLCSTGQMFDTQDLDAEARIRAKGPWRRESVPNKLLEFPHMQMRKVAFRNRRDLTFEETAASWGFNQLGVSHGMALADLDNDGDLDLVMNNLNGAAGVYRNESGAPRVAVRLKGNGANTRGIGAKIRLYGGAVPMQSQEMICGGRYLSSDDAIRVFAAGRPTNSMRLEVSWPGGGRSVVNGVRANRLYEVDESGAEESSKLKAQSSKEAPGPRIQAGTQNRPAGSQTPDPKSQNPDSKSQTPDPGSRIPLFEDVSALLGHRHHEEAFDDFARQPLLSRKLSQLGPGVAWLDLDGDGADDLVIGSGKGGTLAVYRNNGRGGFERLRGRPWDGPVTRDQTTILGWSTLPGKAVILAGLASYEDGLAAGACVKQYRADSVAVEDVLSADASSAGPMAMADWNGDGRMVLFVGGRVIPGRYPEPASSRFLRIENGKWEIDAENSKRLKGVGMVSGAVFSDLDGDGKPELILACEWGPIRIFRNQDGALVPWDPVVRGLGSRISGLGSSQDAVAGNPLVTSKSQTPDPRPQTPEPRPQTLITLSAWSGWWNGVTTGDLDGDGRPDIIAANWGLNTQDRTSRRHPRRLYFGDLAGNGGVDLVDAWLDAAAGAEAPARDLRAVSAALPFIKERFPTFAAYGRASLRDIYGDKLNGLRSVEVATLETTVFLNRGDHFETRPLPAEAQWAPAFAVCVGDCDGDGNEDVFLSQNFFAMNPESQRCDSGRGLWLRGDGRGDLAAVPGQESGVRVYGEQRGAAVGDYDGDGRVDLVVTQNGAETRLFHNTGARPGLRVRLRGPAGNPAGIGAQIRLVFETGQGPVREIHAGSGYWSQDSPVAVLALPRPASAVWVRWPGGRTTVTPLPAGAGEIAVDPGGKLEVPQ